MTAVGAEGDLREEFLPSLIGGTELQRFLGFGESSGLRLVDGLFFFQAKSKDLGDGALVTGKVRRVDIDIGQGGLRSSETDDNP